MQIRHFVYVIESLSQSDIHTGQTEKDSLVPLLRLAQIPHHCSSVSTLVELRVALGAGLAEQIRRFDTRLNPIIHISAHGDEHGIVLTNGEIVRWDDLREMLLLWFNILEGNLLICLSSCKGMAGCRMAMHVDKNFPFWAIVGSNSRPTFSQAAIGFASFYELLLKNPFDLPTCVGSMRVAAAHHDFGYLYGAEVRANWIARATK